MKRSKPLRADPEKVAAFIRRGREKGLQRRGAAPRPGERKKPAHIPKDARRAAMARTNGLCVVCRQRATQLHHALSRQAYPDLITEADNLVPVCKRCHERHESATARIPFQALPSATHALIERIGDRAALHVSTRYPREGPSRAEPGEREEQNG